MNEKRVVMERVRLPAGVMTAGAVGSGAYPVANSGMRQDRGSDVAGLITEIVQRDIEARRHAGGPARRRRIPVTALLLAALCAFCIWNFLRVTAPPELPAAQVEASARATLYLISSSLDAHRREHGALPASLREMQLDSDGITYAIDAGRYVLVARFGDLHVIYREGQDKAAFGTALRPGAGS